MYILIQELGCNGHTLNLVVDSCWNKSEAATLKQNMIKDRAAKVFQRAFCPRTKYISKGFDGIDDFYNVTPTNDVSSFIVSMTKLFPSTVDGDADPRLQETNTLNAYVNESKQKYRLLPGKLGSRQSYNVEVAQVIVDNTKIYSDYFDKHRSDSDPNNLCLTCELGINDKYIQGCLRARTFVSTAFNNVVRFFTHNSSIRLPMIGTVMKCADSYIRDLEFLNTSYPMPKPPPVNKLGEDILIALQQKFPNEIMEVRKT